MPLYQFHCCHCGSVFEQLHKTAVYEMPCVWCGRGADRVVSAPAPHRVYAENPASPENWRRHQEASQEIRYNGFREARAADLEHVAAGTALDGYAIRSSRARFQTPQGTGPHDKDGAR